MNKPRPVSAARSGVYQPPGDIELGRLRESVAASHGVWADVDVAHVRSKDELLNILARALRLPSTFGHNWDALADVLQDSSWCVASAYVVHIRNAGCAEGALGADWATFLEVLADSTMYWMTLGKPFIVFVQAQRTLPDWT